MINIVIDSNIFISAFAFQGMPMAVFNFVEDNQINVHYSQEIQNEVFDIINRKFSNNTELIEIVTKYLRQFTKIKIQSTFKMSRDPKDDHLLNLAYDCDADFIVTGDHDLLVLKKWKNIKIVTPKDFLKIHRTNT